MLAFLHSNAAYNAIKAGTAELARPLLAEAVPLAKELGDALVLAFVRGNAGLEALFTDDLDRAQNAFDDHLQLCGAHGFNWLASEGLADLAAIAARRGDLQRAARLLGAATTAGSWDGDADVTELLEAQFFAPARTGYGEERWTEGRATGAQLSFEKSIDLALGSAARRS